MNDEKVHQKKKKDPGWVADPPHPHVSSMAPDFVADAVGLYENRDAVLARDLPHDLQEFPLGKTVYCDLDGLEVHVKRGLGDSGEGWSVCWHDKNGLIVRRITEKQCDMWLRTADGMEIGYCNSRKLFWREIFFDRRNHMRVFRDANGAWLESYFRADGSIYAERDSEGNWAIYKCDDIGNMKRTSGVFVPIRCGFQREERKRKHRPPPPGYIDPFAFLFESR